MIGSSTSGATIAKIETPVAISPRARPRYWVKWALTGRVSTTAVVPTPKKPSTAMEIAMCVRVEAKRTEATWPRITMLAQAR